MNINKIIILINLLFLFTYCTKKTSEKVSNQIDTLKNIGSENKKIDFSSYKTIKEVYITNRNGANAFEIPDSNNIKIGIFEFSEKVEIIEEIENWYRVKNRLNGKNIGEALIHKKHTGDAKDITVLEPELNILLNELINGKQKYYKNGKPLDKIFKVEFVTKATFDSLKLGSLNYLTKDSSKVIIQEDAIELKCENKIVKFINKPYDEENRKVFEYVGNYDFLNCFIIKGSYWESHDYKFIDKNTGITIISFEDFPFISANQKHIICMYSNVYEHTGDLYFYTLDNNKILKLFEGSFKYWMSGNKSDFFCGKDGNFYFTITHSKAHWNLDGSSNENFQYARIRLL